MVRRYGTPLTEEERATRHFQRYGTTQLPPRGTGLKQARLTETERYLLVFIGGAFVGAILSYIIAKPAAFKAKMREFKA